MSEIWIAIAVLPVLVTMVVLMECSRLHCARLVQRRMGADLAETTPEHD